MSRAPSIRRALVASLCLLGSLAVVPLAAPAAADVNPMVFPVAGGASWTDTFGAPRSGGRTHAGQDLFAPKMRPLVAAADGHVARIGRLSGISGNYVVIEDAEGWEYLYIHVNNDRPGTDDGANLDLDAFPPGIYPGAKVFSGQTIAYLGDSGNAETTPPHVHFEIRLPDGTPINPASRLRSAVHYTLDQRLIDAHSPVGFWDGTVLAPEGFAVSGWAVDPDAPTSLRIEAYVDRNLVRTFLADEPRPDIAERYPDKGLFHGFNDIVPVPGGTHQICLAVRNDDRGPASSFGCRTVSRSTSPMGTLDDVARVPGGLALGGWSIDSDTAAPTDVHGYVGQSGVATVADLPRADVGAAFPSFGDDHGFGVEVPVGPGTHDVCAYGINAAGAGGTSLFGCRAVPVSSDPVGRVDVVTPGPGQISVSGWALDPDTASSTDIHVYVDGRGTNLGPASQDRQDIAAAFPRWGPSHGFSAAVPVGAGGDHRVCTYAINLSFGSSQLLGCSTVRTPTGSPFGAAELIQRSGGQVHVAGWAIDPDTTAAVDVHVYVGGQGTNLGPADRDRPDLAAHFPAYGTRHGYDRTVPIPVAATQTCVYAIDRAGGNPPKLLGCATV
ncbi:MAG: M23 family metallopeptidase [Acidimicrobiales bacterium]